MPTYLNNVPQPNQTLGYTQNLINQNFITIDAAFQIDHVPYTQSGQGQHNQITFPLTTPYTAPTSSVVAIPSYAANQIGMYLAPTSAVTSNVALPNASTQDIWIQRNTASLSNPPYPMTAYNIGGSLTGGWTYLPSGMLMVWGQTQMLNVTTFDVNYSSITGFPGFSSFFFSPQLTTINTSRSGSTPVTAIISGNGSSGLPSLTKFQVITSTGSNATVNFAWLALGL